MENHYGVTIPVLSFRSTQRVVGSFLIHPASLSQRTKPATSLVKGQRIQRANSRLLCMIVNETEGGSPLVFKLHLSWPTYSALNPITSQLRVQQ